jgi:hexosaminidase
VITNSGRHFLPLSHVKKTVVAASMVKLNVIHWHIVDAESFASCSDQFPGLCAEGAYPNSKDSSSPSRNVTKAIYTTAELRALVAFAKSHGVRIMPEWDMPGHGSWGFGMPTLMTSFCRDTLDPTRPELYDFLRKFLTEMGTIFEEKYLFLGGDEVAFTCFDNSPSVAAWMRSKGVECLVNAAALMAANDGQGTPPPQQNDLRLAC